MMKSERINLDSLLNSPDKDLRLSSIADSIRAGALFVYPTETIYGIGTIAGYPGSEDRIYKAKKRAPENPMILLAASIDHFNSLDLLFPDIALKLASNFWPGLLTLVIPSKSHPDGLAIRVSDHPFITELYRYLDAPLYSTSANLSVEKYINDPDVIFTVFENKIDFMIDAGALVPSAPSTIVKVTTDGKYVVLREGVLSKALIESVLV